jgi:hypothetical protein
MSQGFPQSRLQAAFHVFYSCYSDLDCQNNLPLATCCLVCSIPIVKSFLTHWSSLRFLLFTWSGIRTGRQGMLTLPKHLIPPLEHPCLSHSWICISYTGHEINDCSLFTWMPFYELGSQARRKTVSHSIFILSVKLIRNAGQTGRLADERKYRLRID